MAKFLECFNVKAIEVTHFTDALRVKGSKRKTKLLMTGQMFRCQTKSDKIQVIRFDDGTVTLRTNGESWENIPHENLFIHDAQGFEETYNRALNPMHYHAFTMMP